jgi:(2R)-ethylmalonyl-CoA mutase
LSKNARARAVQLPAWNEALGLPRPWDQQWSLRAQQILAYETDLLEYGDLFDGNPVIAARVETLKTAARAELATLDGMGGAIKSIEYMKSRLVDSNGERIAGIERGDTSVVGVNRFTGGEPSPLTAGEGAIMVADAGAEADQIARLNDWRSKRDAVAVTAALDELRRAAASGANIMPPSLAAARAGATTGEWGDAIRAVFGQYRGPTGVSRNPSNRTEGLDEIRARVDAISARLGRRLSLLVGKPGLDGHSNGAEQIAARARDCGIDITYEGIRMTPAELVDSARRTKAHVIGISVLSGSHIPLVAETLKLLREKGLGHIPVVVGGIIPDADSGTLKTMGVARIYTPKDFEMNRIMEDLVLLAEQPHVGVQ